MLNKLFNDLNYREFFNQYPLLLKLTKVLLIIVVASVIKAIVNHLVKKVEIDQDKKRLNVGKVKTIFSILTNLINFVIYFIALTQILSVFNISTSSILAVAGVGGMAIAFASKSIIEDLISGAFIIMEDQYEIGHWVTIDGKGGTVIDVGMRLTKLRDIDGKEIIIPNRNITSVINHSLNDMRAYVLVNISDERPYVEVAEKIQEAVDKVYNSMDNFVSQPEILGVDSFTEFGYTVLVQAMTKNGSQFNIQRKMREEIIKTLQEAGIEFSRIGDKDGI